MISLTQQSIDEINALKSSELMRITLHGRDFVIMPGELFDKMGMQVTLIPPNDKTPQSGA